MLYAAVQDVFFVMQIVKLLGTAYVVRDADHNVHAGLAQKTRC